ncbi:MOP flippase family protein [Prolixibacteraceae bacterium]|nr:MOP flippase family protein [Prolixibacteraceae bacterium]
MLGVSQNKVASGLRWSTGNKILTSLFGLLQIVVLTRYLEKSAFGEMAIAFIVINFTHVFVDMGFTSAVMHKQDITSRQYASVYWMSVMVSILLYGCLTILSPLIAIFYTAPSLTAVVRVLGLNLLLITVGRLPRTLLQKHFRFKEIFIGETLSVVAGTVSAIFLAIRGYGIYSLVYSTLVKTLVSTICFLLLDHKHHPVTFQFYPHETKPFLRVGMFASGTSLLDFISEEIDVMVLGVVLSSNTIGIYVLCKELVLRFFRLVNPIIHSVLQPYFSLLQKENKILKVTFMKVVRGVALINFPVYMLMALGAKEILSIFYGVPYEQGQYVLCFLALAHAVQSVGAPVGALQIATGRTDLGFYWTIFRVCITPIVIYIGSLYGMNMVAAAYFVLCLFYQYPAWRMMIKKMIAMDFISYLMCYGRSFVAMIIALGIGFGLSFAIPTLAIGWQLVCKSVIVMTLYLTLIFFIDRVSWREYIKWGKQLLSFRSKR